MRICWPQFWGTLSVVLVRSTIIILLTLLLSALQELYYLPNEEMGYTGPCRRQHRGIVAHA